MVTSELCSSPCFSERVVLWDITDSNTGSSHEDPASRIAVLMKAEHFDLRQRSLCLR